MKLTYFIFLTPYLKKKIRTHLFVLQSPQINLFGAFFFPQTFLFLNSDRKIKNPEYKFPHIRDHYYGNK